MNGFGRLGLPQLIFLFLAIALVWAVFNPRGR
jgi:hypothetical protein